MLLGILRVSGGALGSCPKVRLLALQKIVRDVEARELCFSEFKPQFEDSAVYARLGSPFEKLRL